MIETVKKLVFELLNDEKTGHNYEHIERVYKLSLSFCEKEDVELVSLIALLHDVDDYKLVGLEEAKQCKNARLIMTKASVPLEMQNKVIENIEKIGYSKLLNGIRPNMVEGMIVSDADMCEAIGVTGIIRTYTYSMNKNKPFFDKNKLPIVDIGNEEYVKRTSDSSVNHLFEKALKLKKLMLTKKGLEEATIRHNIMVEILRQVFREENALEWDEYLTDYLKKEYND